ncbi:hypothetical protein LR48_Vigan07g107200 [Vigna angularis]|uniref:Myb/SANT-like domain-containing protein n=1 Tax=Phaseolus angularis TaxID=3914 RepID=A0A0L9UX75_PHAAN|nr:hypothetical protein LR48_Vigan07g107200 [Vigna angularis]
MGVKMAMAMVMLPCLIKAMNNKDACTTSESKCSVEYESSIDHRTSYAHGSYGGGEGGGGHVRDKKVEREDRVWVSHAGVHWELRCLSWWSKKREGGGDLEVQRFKMNRGKAAAIESFAPIREFMKWTEDMDAHLLHCMIEESQIGNRVDGSWTSQAYSNIVDHLHSFGYVAITKNNVKNSQKVLKDKWREVHDLFSGLSGFALNPVSMKFHAEDEVWMDLIQPDWTRYRDPTPSSPPPSVDEYSPRQTQSVPSVPFGGTSSSRDSKRKAPMVDVIDSQFDKLTTNLNGFAGVLSSSNVHFGVISDEAVRQVTVMEDRNQILRRNSNYTYTEADIYEMLSAMNIADENLLEQCYDFLCGNPTCTKRLMGLPPHKRWNKLCKMISGGDC